MSLKTHHRAVIAPPATTYRKTTLLLAPWSRRKAISFTTVRIPMDALDIPDAAFVDIGHVLGNSCTVAITRALAAHSKGRNGASPSPA